MCVLHENQLSTVNIFASCRLCLLVAVLMTPRLISMNLSYSLHLSSHAFLNGYAIFGLCVSGCRANTKLGCRGTFGSWFRHLL